MRRYRIQSKDCLDILVGDVTCCQNYRDLWVHNGSPTIFLAWSEILLFFSFEWSGLVPGFKEYNVSIHEITGLPCDVIYEIVMHGSISNNSTIHTNGWGVGLIHLDIYVALVEKCQEMVNTTSLHLLRVNTDMFTC